MKAMTTFSCFGAGSPSASLIVATVVESARESGPAMSDTLDLHRKSQENAEVPEIVFHCLSDESYSR